MVAPADATNTNDAAICTTAKTRNFRFATPVTRGPPLVRPKPWAPPDDGSRGMYASNAGKSGGEYYTPQKSALAG